MASKRKRPKSLSDAETARIVETATELHRALAAPLIDVLSHQYRAKAKLHAALVEGLEEITGELAPWYYGPKSAPPKNSA